MSTALKQKTRRTTLVLYTLATIFAVSSGVFGFYKFLGNLITASGSKPIVTINYFYAYPDKVVLGSPTTLYWSCSPSNVSIELWNQTKNQLLQYGSIPSGSFTDYPNQATWYYLKCAYGGKFVANRISVNLDTDNTLPQLDFSANPQNITRGESSVLSWSTVNAQSCTASGAWSGLKSTSGSETVFPSKTSTYNLSCSNQNGSALKSVTVSVSEPRPVVSSFTATPDTVYAGEKVTLSWTSVNADSCNLSLPDKTISVKKSGKYYVYPERTTNYYITCSGKGGVSDPDVVTVTVFESCSMQVYNESYLDFYPTVASYDVTGRVVISLPCLKTFTMEIYTTSGQRKFKEVSTRDEIRAFVYNWANGVYKANLIAQIYVDGRKSNYKTKSKTINFTVMK